MTENEIGTVVVDTAVQVHRALGTGLLETVYEVVIAHELRARGLQVERQVAIPIQYKELQFMTDRQFPGLKKIQRPSSIPRVSPDPFM